MASIPASELAREVLEACLAEGTWPARPLDDLIERALDDEDIFCARAATRALFGVIIERLGDLFEPALCDVYARLFAHVISKALPEYDPERLVLRYNRVRQVRRFQGGEVLRVFVLSRVTLGADIAVTSVALSAAKQRFPDAEICLVGPEKNAALFAADPRIVPVSLRYGRASLLRERLLAAAELAVAVEEPNSIVIDPDSRLTQLGLLPISGDDDARYYFFESRAYGGAIAASLPRLASAWLEEVFDIAGANPYIAPMSQSRLADVAVSWGVGENEQKRVAGNFELEVTRALLAKGYSVVIDRGAGGEEAERIDRIVRDLGAPANLHVHDGSYASFAAHIKQCRLYVGYDSVGQHAAAASGVPLISFFKGHVSRRMLSRWKPDGPNAQVLVIENELPQETLVRALRVISGAEAASGASTG